MRISDWSSDVCSSDLEAQRLHGDELGIAGADAQTVKGAGHGAGHGVAPNGFTALNWVTGISGPQPWKPPTGLARAMAKRVSAPPLSQIGRASGRERVCQYV